MHEYLVKGIDDRDLMEALRRTGRGRVSLPSIDIEELLVEVVEMLVRDHAGVDRLRLDADRLEAARKRSRSKAAVDENSRAVALDQNRVRGIREIAPRIDQRAVEIEDDETELRSQK